MRLTIGGKHAMHTAQDLQAILQRIAGRGYKAYKDLEGAYRFPDFTFYIDHVQGDPFATPSRVRVQLAQTISGFPEMLLNSEIRRIALADYLTRQFAQVLTTITKGRRGSGQSGQIQIDRCGQEILARTSALVDREQVEARFTVGLPAAGRRVLSQEAEAMLLQEIPAIVQQALIYTHLPAHAVRQHVEVAEDQEFLRLALKDRGLVAFVANGAILPRRSGVDDRPRPQNDTEPLVPFQSPPTLEVEFNLPNCGKIRGMGIPPGVTLIVGGGFHGKSTLLRALERGVYNHIPGDGREYVVAIPEAYKIRAEDGRRVENVNITPFINHLPFGKDTAHFSTENASGSTSQAANIMEALEIGSQLLLIDEDTSATNFMIRDERMQELVTKAHEPITPFVDKVRQLSQEQGVSTILVMGGSGDYFDVADTVIMLESYTPHNVSTQVQEILQKHAATRHAEGGSHFGPLVARMPLAQSFDARRGPRAVKIDVKGLHTVIYGTTTIDLSGLEQLVDASQTRAIGDIIWYYAQHYAGKEETLRAGLTKLFAELRTQGLDLLSPRKMGNYALPRIFEVAAAINRLRTLRCKIHKD
jgi:predicted ABC-class ATPase